MWSKGPGFREMEAFEVKNAERLREVNLEAEQRGARDRDESAFARRRTGLVGIGRLVGRS